MEMGRKEFTLVDVAASNLATTADWWFELLQGELKDAKITMIGTDIKKDHLVFHLNDWDGYAVNVLGLAPMAELFGYSGLYTFLMSTEGIVLAGILLVILTAFITMLGMRFYARLQLVCFIFTLMSVAVFIALLATSSQASFAQAFNAHYANLTGNPDLYNTIVSEAEKGGFQTTYAPTIAGTLAIQAMAIGSLSYGWTGTINRVK
jgi:amino acid transporter